MKKGRLGTVIAGLMIGSWLIASGLVTSSISIGGILSIIIGVAAVIASIIFAFKKERNKAKK